MSKPMISGKGTKKSSDIGSFSIKRGAGKGDLISSSFGEGWLSNVEDRLEAREASCGNPDCSVVRPSGVCGVCGWEPRGNRGW